MWRVWQRYASAKSLRDFQFQRFRRNKNLQTLLRYDDNQQDLGGEVSRKLPAAAAILC
jgi:hypothetical protein